MTDKIPTFYERAIVPARMGFKVFPLAPGSKIPPKGLAWKEESAQTKSILRGWNQTNKDFGVAIDCASWQDKHLVVVDIDVKKQNGEETIEKLEAQGYEFPPTLSQKTASGGRHLFYWSEKPGKNSVHGLGPGVDTRSLGGYVALYNLDPHVMAECPEWIHEKLGEERAPEEKPDTAAVVNSPGGLTKAQTFMKTAEPAIEGQGGNAHTYAIAARLKDFGADQMEAFELMADWNENCQPPWDLEELGKIIENAYRYGKNVQGVDTPEAEFEQSIEDLMGVDEDNAEAISKTETIPKEQILAEEDGLAEVLKLNEEYAFTLAGGNHIILWETQDSHGKPKVEYLKEEAFHKQLSPHRVFTGEKLSQLSKLWMNHPRRRSYRGLCFMPGQETPNGWYNLWKGFAVAPKKINVKPVDQLLEHVHLNICNGDAKLAGWLITYFAHMIQKPHIKPLTALVFKGGKGTGKSALVDRIGYLLGPHFKKASNSRYLVSNFNTHLEKCLLFCLEEAFWSGDKTAEGVLKELVTGANHMIEPKGGTPYEVKNLTRVVMVSNEDWAVPASEDERRYAVFEVGDGRKQDGEFFHSMRVGMEQEGGAETLLQYLMEFDINRVDIDRIPKTNGLLEQKIESFSPFQKWWLECLEKGLIASSDFDANVSWSTHLSKAEVRASFQRYVRDNDFRYNKIKDDRAFTRALKKVCPAVQTSRKAMGDGSRAYSYQLPTLSRCREIFEAFIGHEIKWTD